ncbi:MAG: tRNA (N6-isopentenyl adenosine(37)-C2)-methylthiotransferase MiaB [Bacteroidales bacterium]|jgi:tRNA-2-methylthio-N6-dimethylallyladenosine synthase
MNKSLYIETYGCQMNFSDSEIVNSILRENNSELIDNPEDADIILINTCSIRDNAEKRIFNRLRELKYYKKKNKDLIIGIIGCMAGRLQHNLLSDDSIVDVVVGPDSYRELPILISNALKGKAQVNTVLSETETYDDIIPLRINSNGVSAFVSIMRGCENYCAYCVVPYTRGRERSRSANSIVDEIKSLLKNGYKEVTLLGQNVNSYLWTNSDGEQINFSKLISIIAELDENLRIRFATSHPKDLSDELILTIAKYKNICKHIHLPLQSGSTKVLKKMNRKYTQEWYLERINSIKRYIPDCSITTDLIAGFCDETEEDHNQTLEVMKLVGYDYAYMFKYSERPNTLAQRKYENNVPEEEKNRRLQEIIDLQQELSLQSNKKDIDKVFEVLVEGVSKRSDKEIFGRNSQNKVIIFERKNEKPGDYVRVKVTECTAATLKGERID